MRKQLIVSSSKLQLVAMLATAGYPYRYVSSEGNYLFEDTGDIDLMVEDFEKGAQGITDCKALLTTYDELLRQSGGQSGSGQTEEPMTPRAGNQVVTSRNFGVMALWHMNGFQLRLVSNTRDGKFDAVVHDDGSAKGLLMKFRNGECYGNLAAYSNSLVQVRNMLKAAQRTQAQPFAVSVSLNNQQENL
jgi:hypothetical protein